MVRILNTNEGAFKLNNSYNQLIMTTPSTVTSRIYKGAVKSGLGWQSDETARVAVSK